MEDKKFSDITYSEWLTGMIASAMIYHGAKDPDTISTMSSRIATMIVRKISEKKSDKSQQVHPVHAHPVHTHSQHTY
jgi:hypothetical protein